MYQSQPLAFGDFHINKIDPAAELDRNPEVSNRFSLIEGMRRPGRDGTAEPVSRDYILRHERGQENVYFPF